MLKPLVTSMVVISIISGIVALIILYLIISLIIAEGSYDSIYPTLDALETNGCVEKEKETSERGKIMYSITDKGRELLREWRRR